MKDVITSLVTTFERIIASPKSDELFTAPSRTAYMQEEMKIEDVTVKKTSALAQALMKAVCSSRSWIEDVALQKGEQFSARILVIKGLQEDPTQYTAIVNSIFAC